MMELAASSQPQDYLRLLLQLLACPVDPSSALTVIRDPLGEVVFLRSDKEEYPVVNNIPRMMPPLEERRTRTWGLWETLLARWWEAFGDEWGDGDSPEDDPVASYIGQRLGSRGRGLFLDVGCGISPLPRYMAACGERLSWVGIDPALGDQGRHFPFVQGLGEYLPFRTEVFDGALYNLVLSNLLDPLQAMHHTRRAVKPGGRVFVRYCVAPIDARYIVWKTLRILGLARPYNEFYQWVYTKRSLRRLLYKAGFAVEEDILLCEICPHRARCRDIGTEFLAIGRRR